MYEIDIVPVGVSTTSGRTCFPGTFLLPALSNVARYDTRSCLFSNSEIGVSNSAVVQVLATLRSELFRALLLQKIEFFDTNSANRLTSLLSSELESVRNFVFRNVSRDRGPRAVLEVRPLRLGGLERVCEPDKSHVPDADLTDRILIAECSFDAGKRRRRSTLCAVVAARPRTRGRCRCHSHRGRGLQGADESRRKGERGGGGGDEQRGKSGV